MLPKQLKKLKQELANKVFKTSDDLALLEELNQLDSIENRIEKGQLNEVIRSYGGTGVCRHCGQPL